MHHLKQFWLPLMVFLLFAIRAGAQTVTATIPTGQRPQSLAINTVTHRVYIANQLSSSVTVIDEATGTVLANIRSGGSGTSRVAVDEQANRIYAGNFYSEDITVIDGATNTAIALLECNCGLPDGIAVNPVTHKLYVASKDSDLLTIIDGTTLTFTAITMESPLEVAFDNVLNLVYVCNFRVDTLTVLDSISDMVISVLPTGSCPTHLAVDQTTHFAYVQNLCDATVTVINGQTSPPSVAGSPVKAGQSGSQQETPGGYGLLSRRLWQHRCCFQWAYLDTSHYPGRSSPDRTGGECTDQ
jgi:YVTN family beta-propeller protein